MSGHHDNEIKRPRSGGVESSRVLLRPRARPRAEGRRQSEPQREPPEAAGHRHRTGQ